MKLKSEIVLTLVAIGLTIIVISGFLYYYNAKSTVLKQVVNQLQSISESKKQRLEGIVSSNLQEMQTIQNRAVLKQYLSKYIEDTTDRYPAQSYKLLLYNALTRIKGEYKGIEDASIADINGNVLVSTNPQHPKNIADEEYFKHAVRGEECLHFFSDAERREVVWFNAGVLESYSKVLGIIVLEYSVDEIESITNDYTGLGTTGETTIGGWQQGKILFITKTRFIKKSLFQVANSTAMHKAIGKEENVYKDLEDYRGAEVIASSRYIFKTGWGLVTKIDRQEALIPVQAFKAISFYIGCFSVIILILISFIIAENLVRPINIISSTALKISEGDLQQRVSIHSKNELGDLASSFNSMTESLVLTQQRLEEKLSELDRSNVALEKFAYIVSHDLKAPLHSISSLAEIISMELKDKASPETNQLISMLHMKVKQMHELINGILAYSKVGVDIDSQKERVDLQQIIDEVREAIVSTKNVDVHIETALPELYIERVLIFQLFQNLISNGIKYNYNDEIKIAIGWTDKESDHLFFVRDNGIGIPEEYYEKIFDIFQTLQSKNSDSTGIGLSIVKKIVETKGGKIWVESTVNKGSTFFFTLPKETPKTLSHNRIN
ncbi:MAG TPA: ATP-binding protein [Cytophagaceae bacterium]|jgi:signal transduction histidine kinase